MSPFPRLTHEEAMRDYAIDRPDLRFDLKMADLAPIAKSVEFNVFQNVLDSGGIVKGFAAPGCSDYTRGQIDELTDFVRARGANGLIAIGISGTSDGADVLDMSEVKSNILRFLSEEHVRGFAERTGAQNGDLVLMIAGEENQTNQALGALRHEMGGRLKLGDPNEMAFALITDFPLFEWNHDEDRWDASHHAFCMPKDGYIQYMESDPSKVIAQSYDLICNGIEMASGSIRVHERELQEKIFGVLGYSKEQVSERFAQILDAFEYGAPPHGGIAPGIDRLIMVLLGKESIRDVIAFPKTQSQMDPLFGSPSAIDESQLEELNIRLIPVED